MVEYIIIGDTDEYDACLITVCRGMKKEQAEKVLERMLHSPTENDKRLMAGHRNFRIEAVDEEGQWWNDPFLMSD